MIRKYRYGTPFDTEALTEKIETAEGAFPYGEISQNEGFAFTYIMDEDDIVYGLGESNRGINKRGYCYISNCTDDAIHTEGKETEQKISGRVVTKSAKVCACVHKSTHIQRWKHLQI